ncbi:MAG: tetratricopeptide repeat protein [Imperialibacter sp.]|uniref:tetratricopeptide repeat protein n=1 Tax=Imperialibacter sp. TaxID=2038411 RepID=UPI003A857491
MKNFAIAVLLTFAAFNLFAQEQVSLDELFQIATRQQQQGDYDNAIANYTTLLDYADDDEIRRQIFIKRGIAKSGKQDYKSAILDFTESIKLDSTDLASFVDRGKAYYRDLNFDKAESDFFYILEVNKAPKMFENCFYWLANIEFARNNFQKSIEYCNKVLMSNPLDSEVWFIKGVAYSNMADNTNAIKSYDNAIKASPDYVEAIANRGVAKINLLTGSGNPNPSKKETKDACKDLKRAFELGDTSVEDLLFLYCK